MAGSLIKIGVVILNWNGTEDTLACLASVRDAAEGLHDKALIDIMVVDNGSSPALTAASLFLTEHDNVAIAQNHENLGFSGGMNVGIQAFQDRGFDAVWLLNNDTIVNRDALRELISHKANHPQHAMIGSKIICTKGHEATAHLGHTYFKHLGFSMPVKSQKMSPYHEARRPFFSRVDYIDGAAMFIDLEALARAGGFPRQNFLYYEELNLASALGGVGTVGVCETSEVRHAGGKTAKSLDGGQRAFYSTLAALRYTQGHAPQSLTLVFVLRLASAATRDIKHLKLEHSKGALLALTHFLKKDRNDRP